MNVSNKSETYDSVENEIVIIRATVAFVIEGILLPFLAAFGIIGKLGDFSFLVQLVERNYLPNLGLI